jgi:hypothetical protein
VERVRTEVVQGREIVCIDYANLRETEMLAVVDQARDAIVTPPHKKLVLTNFSNCFVTPRFVRYLESVTPQVNPWIERNALVGLNKPKMMILKGFNLLLGTDYRAFSSEHEALEYLLVTEHITEPLAIF